MSNYSNYGGDRGWGAKEKITLIAIIVIFSYAVLLPIIRSSDKVSDIRTIRGTVTEKTVKRDDDEDKYLVFVRETGGYYYSGSYRFCAVWALQ